MCATRLCALLRWGCWEKQVVALPAAARHDGDAGGVEDDEQIPARQLAMEAVTWRMSSDDGMPLALCDERTAAMYACASRASPPRLCDYLVEVTCDTVDGDVDGDGGGGGGGDGGGDGDAGSSRSGRTSGIAAAHVIVVLGKLFRLAAASLEQQPSSCGDSALWVQAVGEKPPFGTSLRFFRRLIAHLRSVAASASVTGGMIETHAGRLLYRDAEALCSVMEHSGANGGAVERAGYATRDDLAAELVQFQKWFSRCHRRQRPAMEVLLRAASGDAAKARGVPGTGTAHADTVSGGGSSSASKLPRRTTASTRRSAGDDDRDVQPLSAAVPDQWSRGGVCDTEAARRVIKNTTAEPVVLGLFCNVVMQGDSSGLRQLRADAVMVMVSLIVASVAGSTGTNMNEAAHSTFLKRMVKHNVVGREWFYVSNAIPPSLATDFVGGIACLLVNMRWLWRCCSLCWRYSR
jgi:hypothetical protein